MKLSTFCLKISVGRAAAVGVVCFMAWVAAPAMGAQTPSYTITSTAGDTSGTCTNQSAGGATLDANCTVYAAFAAVTALNNTGSSSPIITFGSSLNGKTITMSTPVAVTGNVQLVGPGSGTNAITLSGNSTFFGGSGGSTGGFLTQNGSTSSTTIYGLTFTKFANSGNGGVVSQPSGSGTLGLINDTFTQNVSQGGFGGAVYVGNGPVVVSGSTFTQNLVVSTASAQGGGAISASTVSVTGSSFVANEVYAQNNTAAQLYGGAIYAGYSANIMNSSFTGNQLNSTSNAGSLFEGGAVAGGSVIVGTSSFQANEIQFGGSPSQGAEVLGGAVFASTLTMTSSEVFDNSIQATTTAAEPYGGAVCAFAGSIANSFFFVNTIAARSGSGYLSLGGAVFLLGNVSGTVFVQNNATGARFGGGALFGSGTYTNDTFYGNGASAPANSMGGAIAMSGTSYLYNDTIVGNGSSTVTGGGVFGAGASYTVAAYNTVISGNTGQNYVDEEFVTDKSNNYMDNSMTSACTVNCTPMLSAVGAYGGPTIGAAGATQVTATMIPLPGSPLLAAGSTSYAGMPTTDARGYPRTTTYAGVAHEDIGAAEANYTLAFVQQPTRALVGTNISPAPTVQMYESGVAFGSVGGVLGIGATAGTPSISSVATTASGLESLSVSFPAIEGSDTLVASVTNGAATPVTVASVNSAAFNIYNYVLVFATAPVTPQATGTANTVTVAIDSSDGYATTKTNSITLTVTGPNGYSMTYGPTAASAANGAVTFSTAALTTAGTYTYTASGAGFTSVSATQVVSGPMIAFISAPPATVQQGGNAGTVMVGLYNGTGAIDTAAANTVTLAVSGPTTYSYSTAAVNGVATFSLSGVTLNTAGTYVYTASSSYATNSVTAAEVVGGEHTWVVNAAGRLMELNSSGALVTTGVGTGGSAASYGGVAFDACGNVWSVNSGANVLTFATSTGGSVASYSGGGLNAPVSVAVDGAGMVWVANSGNNTVSAFTSAGAVASGTAGIGTSDSLSAPSAVGIDGAGSLWVTNKGGNTVSHVFGGATPVVTPLASAVSNETVGTAP